MGDPLDAITAGGLAYVDDRLDDARAHWERAFRDLRELGADPAAARVATLLGELHWGGLGNPSIGRGWLQRARRLLDGIAPCVELGYWELARLACDRPDPGEIHASAERALAVAAEFGDVGLHTRALADLGYALVSLGRLNAGFARLDEALAALTGGEVADPFVVSTTCCALLSACDRAGDVDRAQEWLRIVRGFIADGRPRMLGAHCELVLGGVMCAAGQWTQAEQAVRSALERSSGATAAQRTEASARLAELNLDRGRVDEAAELLAPIEDECAASAPLAQVHLARGEPELALAVLARANTTLGGDVLRRSALLRLTVESALACGRTDDAMHAATELRALADGSDADVVVGAACLADGLLATTPEAIVLFEQALAAFTRARRPLLAAHAHLALADVAPTSAEAVVAARSAHAIAARLGNAVLRDRSAAQLRKHGATAPRATSSAPLHELTGRETEILDGLRRGDTNGEIAARLYLSPKTVEHHVSRVLAKLGVRTRAEAAAFATRASPPQH